MQPNFPERRVHRAKNKSQALSLWLEAWAHANGVRSAALASKDGLPIACTGDENPELFAAAASLFANNNVAHARRLVDDIHADSFSVFSDHDVVIARVGGGAVNASEAAPHVRRILA